MRDEIRQKFMGFGINTENSVFEQDYPVPIDWNVGTMPILSKEPVSVFSPFTPDQYERFGKPRKQHLFEQIEVITDTSKG